MKTKVYRTYFTAMAFWAGAANADIIQGTITDAVTNAPLAGVRVATDSAHAVFSGADGIYTLDTQNNSSGLALPQSHEPGLHPSAKSRLSAKINSAPVGSWDWFNLLGRPVSAHAAANWIAASGPTNPAQANPAQDKAALAKAAATQAMNSLSYQKAGYLPAAKIVDGNGTNVNVQLQSETTGGGDVDAWYEAEAPGNKMTNLFGAGGRTKCGATCTGAPKEGDACCLGGYEVTQLLGRCSTAASSGNTKTCKDEEGPGGSGVLFNGIKAPKAGTYDVTWWYHCGSNDNWNDHDCGGNPAPAWMTYYNPKANPQPGCRPHVIVINGKEADGPNGEKFWQFPCFGSSWATLHAATTTLTLAAGDNAVQLAAPRIGDLDAVDLDAIHVQAVSKGNPPRVVAPTPLAGDGRK